MELASRTVCRSSFHRPSAPLLCCLRLPPGHRQPAPPNTSRGLPAGSFHIQPRLSPFSDSHPPPSPHPALWSNFCLPKVSTSVITIGFQAGSCLIYLYILSPPHTQNTTHPIVTILHNIVKAATSRRVTLGDLCNLSVHYLSSLEG